MILWRLCQGGTSSAGAFQHPVNSVDFLIFFNMLCFVSDITYRYKTMFTLKNQLLTPLLAFSLVTTQHSVALASPSFDKQTSIEWLSDQGIPLTQGTDFHTTANITPSDLATQIETLASLMTQIATLQNAVAQEMQPAE